MKTDLPRTIHLKDYAPPSFLISDTALDIALHPSETRVRATLSLRPNPDAKAKAGSLRLDGECLKLIRVSIDGVELPASRYAQGEQGSDNQ